MAAATLQPEVTAFLNWLESTSAAFFNQAVICDVTSPGKHCPQHPTPGSLTRGGRSSH